MKRSIRQAGILPVAIAAVLAGAVPGVRGADLPCGGAPTRDCVLDLILKTPSLQGEPARWFSLVKLLARSGRAADARRVADRRLGGAFKARALLLIDGIDAARRGDVAKAKAISRRFGKKVDRVHVALVLWAQGKSKLADEMVEATGKDGIRILFLFLKAHRLATAGKTSEGVEEFGRALALLSKEERADSADYFWGFVPLIPVGQRVAVLPRLAALVPDQTGMFDQVTQGLVRDLIDLGATKQATRILDRIRVQWFGTPPNSSKPKALRMASVERMAYLYGRLGNRPALRHIIKGIPARDRFTLATALARAGDVAAIDRMIAAETDSFFKRRLHAIAAPELKRAGRDAAALRLARSFAKLAGPPGKDAEAVEGWAYVASMANQPLALLSQIKDAKGRRTAVGTLAQQFARSLAYNHMLALFRSKAAGAMKLHYFDFATAPWICRVARRAALIGKTASARSVVTSWYGRRVARGGVKRASDSGEPVDCLSAGGDVAGALGIVMSPHLPERLRLPRLLELARMLPAR